MKSQLHLVLLFLFSTLFSAGEPPPTPTIVYLTDGDLAEYTQASVVPDNWVDPGVAVTWKVAPAGFGTRSYAEEVSTLLDSSSRIRLRQRFELSVLPEALRLSVRQEVDNFEVHLNGALVLDLEADALPAPDPLGFRHYDLSAHIGLLSPTGNLLAVHTEGSLLLPILHGTPSDPLNSALAIDVTRTRCPEGGPLLEMRVFRRTPTSSLTRLYLPTGTSSATDFVLRHKAEPLRLIINDNGSYFGVPFAGEETETIVQLEVIDDIHAEGQEGIELRTHPSAIESTRLIIPRNDTIVTRTAAMGEGSLHQAIENAERTSGIETIQFSDAEGVPFSRSPVTVRLDSGSPRPYGLLQGFRLEGPLPPGRVTIQGNGLPLLSISGAFGGSTNRDLTLRRLVVRDASIAVESTRYTGTMLIEDCEFINNDRALEIYAREFPAVVRRCLFDGNRDRAIRKRTGLPVHVENCTFVAHAGDAVVEGEVFMDHCTFVGNSARPATGSGPQATNSLFIANGEPLDLRSIVDQGGNLFDDGERWFPSHPSSAAIPAAGARLGDLGFHGGLARSIPIFADSPALDLGLPPDEDSPFDDQRGDGFPRRVGPAPDAGAYERQLDSSDLVIGLQTEPGFDPNAGLYFQWVVIYNSSPWRLSGFRLEVTGLPGNAFLYNASGNGFLDVAGPVNPGAYRVVLLQYHASQPNLRLSPYLSRLLLPDSDLPAAEVVGLPALSFPTDPEAGRNLEFSTESGRVYQIVISEDLQSWRPSGPVLFAESARSLWKDLDPAPPEQRFYRVLRLE